MGTIPSVNWDVILFSAKETAFKALPPTRRLPLEFSDFYVSIDVKRTISRLCAYAEQGRVLLDLMAAGAYNKSSS